MYWSLKKLCNFQMRKEQWSKTDFSQLKSRDSTKISTIVFADLHETTRPSATYVRVAWGEHRGKEIEKDIPVDQVLNKKWTPILSAIKGKHGKTLQTSEEITKRWTEYCQELFNKTNTKVNAELTSLIEISLKLNPSTINDQLLKFEIHAAMNKLK